MHRTCLGKTEPESLLLALYYKCNKPYKYHIYNVSYLYSIYYLSHIYYKYNLYTIYNIYYIYHNYYKSYFSI